MNAMILGYISLECYDIGLLGYISLECYDIRLYLT